MQNVADVADIADMGSEKWEGSSFKESNCCFDRIYGNCILYFNKACCIPKKIQFFSAGYRDRAGTRFQGKAMTVRVNEEELLVRYLVIGDILLWEISFNWWYLAKSGVISCCWDAAVWCNALLWLLSNPVHFVSSVPLVFETWTMWILLLWLWPSILLNCQCSCCCCCCVCGWILVKKPTCSTGKKANQESEHCNLALN